MMIPHELRVSQLSTIVSILPQLYTAQSLIAARNESARAR